MIAKEMDIVNGKHIYWVDKEDKMKWVVLDKACDEEPKSYELANGKAFHTYAEASEYAKKSRDYYALTVRLVESGEWEERNSFYVFSSFDEALAKAKEVIEERALPRRLYQELANDWNAEYGDFGSIQIESYDLGDRLS